MTSNLEPLAADDLRKTIADRFDWFIRMSENRVRHYELLRDYVLSLPSTHSDLKRLARGPMNCEDTKGKTVLIWPHDAILACSALTNGAKFSLVSCVRIGLLNG